MGAGITLWGPPVPMQGTVAQLQLFPYHSAECFSLSGCFFWDLFLGTERRKPLALVLCSMHKGNLPLSFHPSRSHRGQKPSCCGSEAMGMAQHFVIIWDLTKLGGMPRAGGQQANPMVSINEHHLPGHAPQA